MPRQKGLSFEEQQLRIVRAALKCFKKRGVNSSSTDDICRASGISSGTLYYYFKSRDKLLYNVIVYAHTIHNQLLEGLNDADDLIAALIDRQHVATKALNKLGVTTSVYFELMAYADRHPAAQAAFREASARVGAMHAEAIRVHQKAGKINPDIPADVLTEFLSAMLTGMPIVEIAKGQFDWQGQRAVLTRLLKPSNA